jgi:hypothetical protein
MYSFALLVLILALEHLTAQESLATILEEVFLLYPAESVVGTQSKFLFVIVEYRKACQRMVNGPWKHAVCNDYN